ncbi:hypothetical protein FQN50_001079 [Emmonsiellopsis sp. PD_5]|nr:hypothetical protein FQN50_001079 [Emmonsiellopsis sp. PD_5]
MVLHLLGKKSWNVYNADNIARVRRDEAAAQAREEEEARQRQKADAEKRIQILRGLRAPSPSPPPPEHPSKDIHKPAPRERKDERSGEPRRKRRRIAGENDTDRDIRYAREDAEEAEAKRRSAGDVLRLRSKPSTTAADNDDNDMPIVDEAGHISLFPPSQNQKSDPTNTTTNKNPEAEAEALLKRREYEDQYTMRFSNAAGYKQSISQAPWYSSGKHDLAAERAEADIPSKDVWGNEDPRRRERERERISSSDPLALMKRGVKKLREVEGERKRWESERRRELMALKAQQEETDERRMRRERKEKRHSHRHRRESDASLDSLEGFRLDAELEEGDCAKKLHRHSSRKEHGDRRMDRSRDRDGHRHSKRSRSRSDHDRDRDRHRSSRHREKDRGKRLEQEDRSAGWEPAPGKRYSAQFASV